MIKEAYCSTEVYRLLKEKGFDGEIHTTFDKEGYTQASITHQMAMAWLREEKYVMIFIVPAKDENSNLTYCAGVWTWNDDEGIYEPTWAYANYIYEEAVEAALKYVLENLI